MTENASGSPDELHDKALGALLGCAVGDALGAPFEGLWSHSIPGRDELLARFHEYEGYPLGQYTDDTQLTLATVEAIVETGDVDLQAIATRIAALWEHDSVIGPGGVCTRAALTFLKTGDWTSCGAPVGQAGNGTAMRTAPLGLLFEKNADELPAVVGAVSRITHQDARSVAGGIAVAEAARIFAFEEPLDADAFCARVGDAMAVADSTFAQLVRRLPERLGEPCDAAFAKIAAAGASRAEFERPIVTPFVVPTVLAAGPVAPASRHRRSRS